MCFVAAPGALNKAHVQFLEASLVRLARAAKRSPLDNGNTPAGPTLSESDRADMQVFLHNMLGMLPVLGGHAFEQASPAAGAAAPLLTCKGKDVSATGYESTQGFVVKAGSQAVAESVPSMQQHVRGMYDLGQELLGNGASRRRYRCTGFQSGIVRRMNSSNSGTVKAVSPCAGL